MKVDASEIEVNGVKYVPANTVKERATSIDGLECAIIRTYSAGVFMGYIKKREGKEVTLLNARRLWYWKGAASLSQLATEGVKCPESCKFPCAVDKLILTEAIEIIPATKQAKESIDGVKIWKQ